MLFAWTKRQIPYLLVSLLTALMPGGSAVAEPEHEEPFGQNSPEQPGRRPQNQPAPRPGSPEGTTFPAQNVRLLKWFDLADFGVPGGNGNDCWGYVSAGKREYAIMGLSDRTAYVEVSDPKNAVIVRSITHPNSTWCDVEVYRDFAYAVNESSGGMQVIDLRNIDAGQVTLVRSFVGGGLSTSHTLSINPVSGYAYLNGSNVGVGGLFVINLADPANPVHAGTWNTRYVHDSHVVTYTQGPYAGREIAFCSAGGAGLEIVDVTNKSNMFTIIRTTYPQLAYSHQGWLSEDRRYFYLDDELDETQAGATPSLTRIFDVTNLSSPQFVGSFTSGRTAIDHNLYVRGNFIYESNYTSGLRIFDASNPLAPVEVGYFDTYPTGDGLSYDGTWSNYPFLPSGTILVSDINRGLFVLEFDPNSLTFTYPNGLPASVPPNAATPVTVHISGAGAPVNPATVTLHARVDGGPETQTIMTDLGGGDFTAGLPRANCFSDIDFYFTAENTLGTLYQDPPDAPASAYHTDVYSGLIPVFADNFEADRGWTVQNVNLTTGAWVRVVPVGNGGTRGDPPTDFDGSGRCYVTGNARDEDVDGGPTILTSPALDFSAGDGLIGYAYWFYTNTGEDSLVVEVSDNGTTWAEARRYTGGGGGWLTDQFTVSDYVSPTGLVRVRFSVADNPNNSNTEAAVDAVQTSLFECQDVLPGDLDGDGDVDLSDFTIFQLCFGGSNNPPAPTCPPGVDADLDGDGDVDLADFLIFQQNFTGSF